MLRTCSVLLCNRWGEALTVLTVAPAALLDICEAHAAYDLGDAAAQHYALPAAAVARLQLAKWVEAAVAAASVDSAVSKVAAESGVHPLNCLHRLMTYYVVNLMSTEHVKVCWACFVRFANFFLL